jgi:uncharacterized protein (TIGR02001 family)
MRKLALAAATLAVLASPLVVSTAQAQTAPAAAPASDHTFTGNMTLASDYRFRGISQTYLGPTIQGGFDYSHSSGFYVGNWNSNVSGLAYNNGNNIEMDFYGGWKKSWGDWGIDLGGLYYYYDSARWNGTTQGSAAIAANTSGRYDNGELYIAGSWKFITLKYSHSVTDYFGTNSNLARFFTSKDCTVNAAACVGARGGALAGLNESRGNSKGSGYLELNASYEIAPKWTISGHVGHTKVKNYGELSYSDYKLGIAYDLSGWTLGATVVGTNANNQWYYNARNVGGSGNSAKDTGKTTLVLSVAKSF